ncbi:hypothetical protein B0H11DRAFT_2221990 [Mycena galericulata]|nr:hypothetical protein B0H11DRAFT_2221990 [Mycena galericulata]
MDVKTTLVHNSSLFPPHRRSPPRPSEPLGALPSELIQLTLCHRAPPCLLAFAIHTTGSRKPRRFLPRPTLLPLMTCVTVDANHRAPAAFNVTYVGARSPGSANPDRGPSQLLGRVLDGGVPQSYFLINTKAVLDAARSPHLHLLALLKPRRSLVLVNLSMHLGVVIYSHRHASHAHYPISTAVELGQAPAGSLSASIGDTRSPPPGVQSVEPDTGSHESCTAALVAQQIKIRDFAYESRLPKIPSFVLRQVQPRADKALQLAIAEMGGDVNMSPPLNDDGLIETPVASPNGSLQWKSGAGMAACIRNAPESRSSKAGL